MSSVCVARVGCFLLLACFLYVPFTSMAIRDLPSSAPSTIKPLVPAPGGYVTMEPQLNHKLPVFRVKEIKNCMPKGYSRSSAPSRYVNYYTLGSGCAPALRKSP